MNATRPGIRPHDFKSVPDPGAPTLRETIELLNDNIFDAARHERDAIAAYKAIPPGDRAEPAAVGWVSQSRAEKDHWRGYLTAYRIHADVHPELLDQPVGTRCSHGVDCLIGNPNARARPERIPGADDDDERPLPPDRRLPPERDQLDMLDPSP